MTTVDPSQIAPRKDPNRTTDRSRSDNPKKARRVKVTTKPTKYDPARTLASLIKHEGDITSVIAELKISRNTFYNWKRTHRTLSDALDKIRDISVDSRVDKAEENVFNAVDQGDLKASKFVLDRLGKDLGYTTRIERVEPGIAELDRASTHQLLDALRDHMVREGGTATLSRENVVEADWCELEADDIGILKEFYAGPLENP